MAMRLDVFLFVALTFVIFAIKQPCFTNSSSACYSETNAEVLEVKETYIYSSLWQFHLERGLYVRKKYFLKMLLLLAGDVELCPGPNYKMSCLSCLKTVRKNQSIDVCYNCKERFHLKCLKDVYKNGTEYLYCTRCDINGENVEKEDISFSKTKLSAFTNKRGLKIFHQNVNGVLDKLDKISLLLLNHANKNIQIFGVSETHLCTTTNNTVINVEGYTIERKDRDKGVYGGVLCYIRDDINYQRRYDLEVAGIECIWIELLIFKSSSILVCIAYKPPDSSKYIDKSFTTKFQDMISTTIVENKETIISGDLNCDYLVPRDHIEIKDIIKINGFKQLITKPTRITNTSRTLIDIIATTDSTKVVNSIVYANSLSDHDLVGITRKMHSKNYIARKIIARDYSMYDKAKLKTTLRQVQWENCLSQPTYNAAWNLFKSYLSSVIDSHAPLTERKVRGKDNPWLNRDIKLKINSRDYYLRVAKRSNTEIDWSTYKRMRNNVTNSIRHAKANYYRNLFRENISNPKIFWKQIKKSYPIKDTGKTGNTFNINGVPVSDKKEIPNSFCSYFAKVGSMLSSKIISLSNLTWRSFDDRNLLLKINPDNRVFKFKQVYTNDVFSILKNIKSSKSAGIDNIPGALIKDAAEELAAPLSFLANLSFSNGIFPTSEKTAKVTPSYKSGERSHFDNYRPISILNVLSKVIKKHQT